MQELPFPAIVNQADLKSALLLNAINTSLGGVLIRGEKGTGKSSTVRGLKRVLPETPVVDECVFNCHPHVQRLQCEDCRTRSDPTVAHVEMPVVDLPLGATEDRVVGSLDIERAINEGVSALEPGLLARANRGILYIDEVNLLEDHLIDILLDAAASGVNRVEREGVSVQHPAEFILVGTMNPAEGELRPQFLDRFGLQVDAVAPDDPEKRVAIIEIAEAFDRNPDDVIEQYEGEERRLQERIEVARELYDDVTLPPDLQKRIAEICVDAGVEGSRGDIITARCARTMAALEERMTVEPSDVRAAIRFALPHRLPTDPFRDDLDLDGVVDDHFENPTAPTGGEGSPPGGNDAEDQDEPSPDGGGEKSRGGSEDRQGSADSMFTNAFGGLRDYFLTPDRGDGDAEGRSDDRGTESGTGRENDASGSGYLDPIGDGTAAGTSTDVHPSSQDPSLMDVNPLADRPPDEFGTGGSPVTEDDSGKYVTSRWANHDPRGDDIALDASFRSAARRGSTRIEEQDLRVKVRDGDPPALVVFAVDSSASMRAHGHIETAQRIVSPLFRDVRRRGDFVTVVSFRDETADVVVPPTDDPHVAAPFMENLPTGNKTPLSHALLATLRLVRYERESRPNTPAILVVMTDGRPTVAIGDDPVAEVNRLTRQLAAADVHLVVLDLDTGTAGTDVCKEMAEIADGAYVPLFDLSDEERRQVVSRTVSTLRSQV